MLTVIILLITSIYGLCCGNTNYAYECHILSMFGLVRNIILSMFGMLRITIKNADNILARLFKWF